MSTESTSEDRFGEMEGPVLDGNTASATTGRWTVARKVAAMLSGAVILAFAAMATIQTVDQRTNLLTAAVESNVTITKLLAVQMAGGLRWKKVAAVKATYSKMAKTEGSPLTAVFTFDAQGEPLTRYASEAYEGPDLSTAPTLDPAKLKADRLISRRIDNYQVVVIQVTAGRDNGKVGTIAVAWNLAELEAQVASAVYKAAGISTIFLVVLISLLGLVLQRFVGRPLNQMTAAMRGLAGGDLSVAIPAIGRRDEIGAMAHAVRVFKDNANEMERLRAEQEKQKRQAETEKRQAMNELAEDFATSVGVVVKAVSSSATQMQSNARTLSNTAEQTSKQSAAAAMGAEEGSVNVQNVAGATEEMSTSISEISRHVSQSAMIAQQAVDEAQKTNTTIRGLAEAAQKIGEVLDLINDIADQTNLLALNATIEAARAGEAGKGFSVVASEVKNLADQTAKATEDIGNQITSMQQATNDSVRAIDSIGQTISEIHEIATTIASAVEEQGTATQEISDSVQKTAAGTHEVSNNLASLSEAAGETGQAAVQMLEGAQDLAKQAETLQTEVDKFVSQVRTA